MLASQAALASALLRRAGLLACLCLMKCSRAFSAEGLFADRLAFWGLALARAAWASSYSWMRSSSTSSRDSAASAQQPEFSETEQTTAVSRNRAASEQREHQAETRVSCEQRTTSSGRSEEMSELISANVWLDCLATIVSSLHVLGLVQNPRPHLTHL